MMLPTIGMFPRKSELSDQPAIKQFRIRLLEWYDLNKRNLPWRGERDPYKVWVSEIMLQQTRVAVVQDYYSRFLHRFPSIHTLASAREASVLACWSGLGYYRRARMLHTAAKSIVREHSGRFPQSAADLRQLPGIGRYTSAAIASIAWNEPVAVLDGNVERVLIRLLNQAIGREKAWAHAEAILDCGRPGDFNQAMMELGATVCTPKSPQCTACPVAGFCRTRGQLLPVRKREPRRKRQIHYQLIRRSNLLLLIRRPMSESLMPGFWELPEIEHSNANEKLFTLRHSITVTDYTVHVSQAVKKVAEGHWFPESQLQKLPLTGLTKKILRKAQII